MDFRHQSGMWRNYWKEGVQIRDRSMSISLNNKWTASLNNPRYYWKTKLNQRGKEMYHEMNSNLENFMFLRETTPSLCKCYEFVYFLECINMGTTAMLLSNFIWADKKPRLILFRVTGLWDGSSEAIQKNKNFTTIATPPKLYFMATC